MAKRAKRSKADDTSLETYGAMVRPDGERFGGIGSIGASEKGVELDGVELSAIVKTAVSEGLEPLFQRLTYLEGVFVALEELVTALEAASAPRTPRP